MNAAEAICFGAAALAMFVIVIAGKDGLMVVATILDNILFSRKAHNEPAPADTKTRPTTQRAARPEPSTPQPAKDNHCTYCGSVFVMDKRGRCSSCGAPGAPR